MSAPERIWAWYFAPNKRDDLMQGGWNDKPDGTRETEYVRADIADDLLAALEEALDAWETHCKSGDEMQGHWDSDARAAIAKARTP